MIIIRKRIIVINAFINKLYILLLSSILLVIPFLFAMSIVSLVECQVIFRFTKHLKFFYNLTIDRFIKIIFTH